MDWYVVQTMTGREKELSSLIEQVIPGAGFKKCFVIQRECVWRIEGHYKVHIEPLFPSYIFVETDTPEEFFFALKQIPKFSKLLGEDEFFWTVRKEEQELLERLTQGSSDYIIRRSLIRVDICGDIIAAEGALKEFTENIVKKRLRKRYITIEIPFLEQMRRIQIGIKLESDDE